MTNHSSRINENIPYHGFDDSSLGTGRSKMDDSRTVWRRGDVDSAASKPPPAAAATMICFPPPNPLCHSTAGLPRTKQNSKAKQSKAKQSKAKQSKPLSTPFFLFLFLSPRLIAVQQLQQAILGYYLVIRVGLRKLSTLSQGRYRCITNTFQRFPAALRKI